MRKLFKVLVQVAVLSGLLMLVNAMVVMVPKIGGRSNGRVVKLLESDGGGCYSPNQILYPEQLIHNTTSTYALPLQAALQELRAACVHLMNNSNDKQEEVTLRICQELSHASDPLRWIQLNSNNHEEMVYFADAEGYTNTAGLGSMHTLTSPLFMEDHFWNLINKLPDSTIRYYGGARFDPTYPKDQRGLEWQSFGGHYFLLPVLEMRREPLVKISDSTNVTEFGSSSSADKHKYVTTVAINLRYGGESSAYKSLTEAVEAAIQVIDNTVTKLAPKGVAPLLPCVVNRREIGGQEEWEDNVNTALEAMKIDEEALGDKTNITKAFRKTLQKVVLARRADLSLGDTLNPLDALMRLRESGYSGHLLYLKPASTNNAQKQRQAGFFGCSPERLFRIADGKVISEALAGTRPRGADSKADAELLSELKSSTKDIYENQITAKYIENIFGELEKEGVINSDNKKSTSEMFVRRLRDLQHICQRFFASISSQTSVPELTRKLLLKLHPTPAMCGTPLQDAYSLIRKLESFDRGFYAGPFGFVSTGSSDVVVSIRSALTRNAILYNCDLSVFAGAGIVPGSDPQDEWAETSYKLRVMTSLYPQGPMALYGARTANYAWATAIVEELVRMGVTHFYICPGSRSTPLTAAIARMKRKNSGSVEVVSVHDERGAAFRALGSARATERPAVVVTSSGTATANLYPAVMEASNDGVPLLLLTADRPYEARGTGANQAVDQVKMFGDRVRCFRDIPPPSDDVPISLGLSDINHSVNMARYLLGPVHVNIQFRENLAPDVGPIRGDDRVGSEDKFNLDRFVDTPGFQRWAYGSNPWQASMYNPFSIEDIMVKEIVDILASSRRSILVVGRIRGMNERVVQSIVHFAISCGIPIVTDIQSGSLRQSSAVIPFFDHLLKNPRIFEGLKPDVIIQLGHPLISTETSKFIKYSMKKEFPYSSESSLRKKPYHILIHPHFPGERVDPDFTITHRLSCMVDEFLCKAMEEIRLKNISVHSDLSPLVLLGRRLRGAIPDMIHDASTSVCKQFGLLVDGDKIPLTEPQITLALSEILYSNDLSKPAESLFLSNSMPCRDAQAFFYPLKDGMKTLDRAVINRGASGIDGIISSATGFSESSRTHTSLIIGDVAALHDLNSFHGLTKDTGSAPVTTVLINNNGGAIFSFLPIASYGEDVGFEEFFSTPTDTFSFASAASSFDIPYKSSGTYESFKESLTSLNFIPKNSILEANVVPRDVNVAVHGKIGTLASSFTSELFDSVVWQPGGPSMTMIRRFKVKPSPQKKKTLLLLHGWMGSKDDWTITVDELEKQLSLGEWQIIAADLPGHGDSPLVTSDVAMLKSMIESDSRLKLAYNWDLSVEGIARSTFDMLEKAGIHQIDGIVGYSLGGRIALSMKRLAATESPQNSEKWQSLYLSVQTAKLILLNAYPGDIPQFAGTDINQSKTEARENRVMRDEKLAKSMEAIVDRCLLAENEGYTVNEWGRFLTKWYSASIWGDLQSSEAYSLMARKRIDELIFRARDFAAVVSAASPGRNPVNDWRFVDALSTLYISGSLDTKYSLIGKRWSLVEGVKLETVEGCGHALLTEAPEQIAVSISSFLLGKDEGAKKGITQGLQLDKKHLIPASISKLKSSIMPYELEISHFSIDLSSGDDQNDRKGIFGVGWGKKSIDLKNSMKRRRGYIVALRSKDAGREIIGLGEVSPLSGLHSENLESALAQLMQIQSKIDSGFDPRRLYDPIDLLRFDGALNCYIEDLVLNCGISPHDLYPSVRSGIEMAVMSLSSQALRMDLLEALSGIAFQGSNILPNAVRLNGLHTRKPGIDTFTFQQETSLPRFSSWKIKVNADDPLKNAEFVSEVASAVDEKIRLDANQNWNEEYSKAFINSLENFGFNFDQLEYIEEPLNQGENNFIEHVDALEQLHQSTGVKYALDESLAKLLQSHTGSFEAAADKIRFALHGKQGCGAFILKPTLLGFEVSKRLSQISNNLGFVSVISSSFDTGIGISYAAILASLLDVEAQKMGYPTFAHGLGTYTMLQSDTLSPAFDSFVSKNGEVKVKSLSRRLYGIDLGQLSSLQSDVTASDVTEEGGEEISVQAEINLPFSADIAVSRFSDWPQQPRWTPWLSSVAYMPSKEGTETEWTLNVRGVSLSWRAVSSIMDSQRGIMWKSVSGLNNRGYVKFHPDESDPNKKCNMSVSITFVAPTQMAALFSLNLPLKKFIENKLLQWSLQMFRDVVKADLALEKGDVELGDALFEAVEGRASAIEATLLPDEQRK